MKRNLVEGVEAWFYQGVRVRDRLIESRHVVCELLEMTIGGENVPRPGGSCLEITECGDFVTQRLALIADPRVVVLLPVGSREQLDAEFI